MKLKKLIAPIIITIFTILYFIGIISIFVMDYSIPMAFKVIAVIILIGLVFVSIYVLIERIKEIRSGDEDDLSKY